MIPEFPYPLRTFTLPVGYNPIVPSYPAYNNVIINNLYNQISSCYGNRISKIVQNAKKGLKNKFDEKSKYLIMALYVMRRWYNGGFTINLNAGTLNLYWVSSMEIDTNSLLVSVVLSGTDAQMAIQLQAALPSGYMVTLSNTNQAYISTVNQQQPYVYFTLNNTMGWSMLDYNPVIPYPVIQNIIEQSLRILQEYNTGSVYTSLGLTPPAALPNYTIYQNTPFFN